MAESTPAVTTSSQPQNPASPEAAGTSSVVRSAVLIVILLVVIGLWVVDRYVFKPQSEEAQSKLEETVKAHNFKSIEEAQGKLYVTSADVQKALRRSPTRSEKLGENLVEYYCWWGALPLKRRYIAVAYKDGEGKRYHTHLLDAEITKQDLPLSNKEALELAEKALRESNNGPERQMADPNGVAPPAPPSNGVETKAENVTAPSEKSDTTIPSDDAVKPAEPADKASDPATEQPAAPAETTN